jgi:hypothetical protein
MLYGSDLAVLFSSPFGARNMVRMETCMAPIAS